MTPARKKRRGGPPRCKDCRAVLRFARTVASDGLKRIALDWDPDPIYPIALDGRGWAYTPGLPEEDAIPEDFRIDDDTRYRAHNDSCPNSTRQPTRPEWLDL